MLASYLVINWLLTFLNFTCVRLFASGDSQHICGWTADHVDWQWIGFLRSTPFCSSGHPSTMTSRPDRPKQVEMARKLRQRPTRALPGFLTPISSLPRLILYTPRRRSTACTVTHARPHYYTKYACRIKLRFKRLPPNHSHNSSIQKAASANIVLRITQINAKWVKI